MNNRDKMKMHTGLLIGYAVLYSIPEVNADTFGWGIFWGAVGFSVVRLWQTAAREIARTMEDVRRG